MVLFLVFNRSVLSLILPLKKKKAKEFNSCAMKDGEMETREVLHVDRADARP
jgi:hypothetical protein